MQVFGLVAQGLTRSKAGGHRAASNEKQSSGARTEMFLEKVVVVLLALGLPAITKPAEAQEASADVVVYGATPAGVMAAIAASRGGKHVLLLEPGTMVGGMLSGGLTKTDIGRRDTVGGLPNEFFRHVLAYYDKTYGKDSKQSKETHGGIFFEPHVAELVFHEMLHEAHVQVMTKKRIVSANVDHDRIVSIKVSDSSTGDSNQVNGKVFIDASYEGDLMADTGVPYRVGRESRKEFNESVAGMNRGPAELIGSGDHRLQSFNLRSTITNRADIRIPFPKPEHYMPEMFSKFLERINEKHLNNFNELFPDVPAWGPVNGKSDPNKADDIGGNIDYADADPATRQKSYEHTRDVWLSFWYMLGHDPSLSQQFRNSVAQWGLPKDEFVESGNVSPQLYVREARRMEGRYIMSQSDVQTHRMKDDAVAMGSYGIDSHPVQMVLTPKGLVSEGGDIGEWTDPYDIPYRSLTPVSPQNLLVVVDISATHIAYCTIRMEPVFMMLGQAGGLAATIAIDGNTSVQDISVPKLRAAIRQAGIPTDPPFRPSVVISHDANPAAGTPVKFHVVSTEIKSHLVKYVWNFDGSGEVQSTDPDPVWTFPVAKPWLVSLSVEDADGNQSLVAQSTVRVGSGGPSDVTVAFDGATDKGLWDRTGGNGLDERAWPAYHDLNRDKGNKEVTFLATLPESGRYRVAMAFPAGTKRASNVPVNIESNGDRHTLNVDQRAKPTPYAFMPIGEYSFVAGKPVVLHIGTAGTDGDVAIEAVRYIWLGK